MLYRIQSTSGSTLLTAVVNFLGDARQDLRPKGRYSEAARRYIDMMRTKYEENARADD